MPEPGPGDFTSEREIPFEGERKTGQEAENLAPIGDGRRSYLVEFRMVVPGCHSRVHAEVRARKIVGPMIGNAIAEGQISMGAIGDIYDAD